MLHLTSLNSKLNNDHRQHHERQHQQQKLIIDALDNYCDTEKEKSCAVVIRNFHFDNNVYVQCNGKCSVMQQWNDGVLVQQKWHSKLCQQLSVQKKSVASTAVI